MNYFATGIVYTEKAQLDFLSAQVTQAQYEVNQQQANVAALESKSDQFNAFLAEADANKQTALANLNLARDIDASVNSLFGSTALAKTQSDKASDTTSAVARDVATLINKLIFAVEIIDRFGQLVNKQKSSNPLIPDSLISCIAKAASDSNNAIALTLTALQSCYAAEATALRAQQVLDLQNTQMTALKNQFEQSDSRVSVQASDVSPQPKPGLLALSKQASDIFEQKYQQALADNTMVNRQLAHAQQMLVEATTSLSSCQAGLAAATAAAYAA
jgi:hypothetical protein